MMKSLSSVLLEYNLYLKKNGNTYVKSPTNSKNDLLDPYSSHSVQQHHPTKKKKTNSIDVQLEGENNRTI